jgi:hypothetical protein
MKEAKNVAFGSRAAVAGKRMTQPAYPSLGIPRAFRRLRFVPEANRRRRRGFISPSERA